MRLSNNTDDSRVMIMVGIEIEVPIDVFEGLEEVRETSTFNVFDIDRVRLKAILLGYPETAAWIKQNENRYINGILQGFKPQK